MKKTILIVVSIALILASCENDKSESGSGQDQDSILISTQINDVILAIGSVMSFDYSDIELYDSSSHILYFKQNHPEFEKIRQSSFQFCVNGDTIYKGEFWPTFFSSLPSGPLYFR